MPDIQGGLESAGQNVGTGGQMSDEAFNASLASSVAKSKEAPIEAPPASRPDPSADSARDVLRGVQDPENFVSLRDGLTTASAFEPSAPAREPLSGEDAKLVEKAQRDLATQDEALRAGAEAREDLLVRDARDIARDAEDGGALLAALVEVGSRASHRLPEALYDVTAELLGYNPSEGEYADDEGSVAYFIETMDALAQEVRRRVPPSGTRKPRRWSESWRRSLPKRSWTDRRPPSPSGSTTPGSLRQLHGRGSK